MQVLSGKKNLAKNASVRALDSIEAGGWSKAKVVDGRLLPDPGEADASYRPATMVRKEFEVRGPIRRAVASVTGLGLYELRINGRRVGDHVFAPDWTRYCKHIQYQTYDVTDLLREGRNAVGAQLGGGWWSRPAYVPAAHEEHAVLSPDAIGHRIVGRFGANHRNRSVVAGEQ